MCPACLTTVALIAAGASSTGGLGALVLRTLRGTGDAGRAEGRGDADLPYPSDHFGDDVALQESDR